MPVFPPCAGKITSLRQLAGGLVTEITMLSPGKIASIAQAGLSSSSSSSTR